MLPVGLDNLTTSAGNKALSNGLGKLVGGGSSSAGLDKLGDTHNRKETLAIGHSGLKLQEGPSAGDMISDFGGLLKGHLQQVNDLSSQAGKLSKAYALGESVPLHQVMVASEKASVAMELTLQIRNKLLTAYQDMMHMPL